MGQGGDPELERGRLSGHVSRLLSRGLFVRVGPKTYRRARDADGDGVDARLLAHFAEGEVVGVAKLVIRAEGRVSGSSMQRVKEQMDGLIAAGKLEKVEGGYRRRG